MIHTFIFVLLYEKGATLLTIITIRFCPKKTYDSYVYFRIIIRKRGYTFDDNYNTFLLNTIITILRLLFIQFWSVHTRLSSFSRMIILYRTYLWFKLPYSFNATSQMHLKLPTTQLDIVRVAILTNCMPCSGLKEIQRNEDPESIVMPFWKYLRVSLFQNGIVCV
jgi:hypothetical protein